MAKVILFHSALGLRSVEHSAAGRMREASHDVVTPDLYDGEIASSVEDGLKLMDKVGWQTICARAKAALSSIPENAVLAGHSMGAGVVSVVWPERSAISGVVLLHALADIPDEVRPRTPVAIHVADPDPFAPPEQISVWRKRAIPAEIKADVFIYPGSGHFFTDVELPDYDAAATALAWSRILTFLQSIS
jgi:dienelactone hydrolase